MPDFSRALFLDRDGVINRRIPGDYVRNLSQFELLPGAGEAIVRLGNVFGRVIVVTNQQGIGKGLMSVADVAEIHDFLTQKVDEAGGRLDKIYCCPSLASDNDPDRKPGIGMGLRAKRDFPEIDFARSLMIGDSISDMKFAEKLGMPFIFITGENPAPENVTYSCRSLADVPELLTRTE